MLLAAQLPEDPSDTLLDRHRDGRDRRRAPLGDDRSWRMSKSDAGAIGLKSYGHRPGKSASL